MALYSSSLRGRIQQQFGILRGCDPHEAPETGQSDFKILFLGRGAENLHGLLVAKKTAPLQDGQAWRSLGFGVCLAEVFRGVGPDGRKGVGGVLVEVFFSVGKEWGDGSSLLLAGTDLLLA